MKKGCPLIVISKGNTSEVYRGLADVSRRFKLPYWKLIGRDFPFVYRGLRFERVGYKESNGIKIPSTTVKIHDDIDLKELLKMSASAFETTAKDIVKKLRNRNITNARKLACCILVIKTNLSLRNIANIFGLADHSTVVYHKNKFKDHIMYDEEYLEKCTPVLNHFGIEVEDVLNMS